jgi:predicted nucleotidyltransferase
MSTFNTTAKSGGAKPSREWEATFTSWGAAPATTEQTKCENAERAVRKAICASTKLSSKNIEIFTQGSYANRTNVRQDSDVDICVMYAGAFFPDYSMSDGLSDSTLGYTDGHYLYSEFKNDVGAALVSFFGHEHVARGSKAFDVHANTYRIDADVVPAFEHRRFHGTPQNNWQYSGTQIIPDNGGKIVNWPKQNYDNGVTKNDATGRRYKTVTRILKRLRNEMADEGYDAAKPIPSYLIECLVWNVPDNDLGNATLRADVRHALAHLWNQTRVYESCKEWGEVNELKYLFRGAQPWTREQVNSFLQAAWDYIGFE